MSLLATLLDAADGCAVQDISAAQWRLLLDVSAQVCRAPSSRAARCPCPCPCLLPLLVVLVLVLENAAKRVVEDDDDDDFLSRVKAKGRAAPASVTAPSAGAQRAGGGTICLCFCLASAKGDARAGQGRSRARAAAGAPLYYPWDEEIAADERRSALATHSRVQCVLWLVQCVRALCCSRESTSQCAPCSACLPPLRCGPPRRHIAIPPPIIPFNQNGRVRRAFGGGDRGPPRRAACPGQAPPFALRCCTCTHLQGETFADATARAAKQSRDDDDEDSGSGSGSAGGAQSRAGASLVIIPTRGMPCATCQSLQQAGQELALPSSRGCGRC